MPTARRRPPAKSGETPYPPAADPETEPNREVGIPEETGPVRQDPVPIPPPPLPEPPPLRQPAPGHSALEGPPLGPGHLHRVLVDGDLDALRAIATAAHDVLAAGGLSTKDPKIARLHNTLAAALYGD